MTNPEDDAWSDMYLEDDARTDILFWWTSQEECEAIGDDLPEFVPEYLRSEYRSRLGRAGRGRLWSADQFGAVGIPWNTSKPAARLAGERGGIVIHKEDAPYVFELPGFLTDAKLNIINDLQEPAQ